MNMKTLPVERFSLKILMETVQPRVLHPFYMGR